MFILQNGSKGNCLIVVRGEKRVDCNKGDMNTAELSDVTIYPSLQLGLTNEEN